MLEIADNGEFSPIQVSILDVYYIKAVICAQFDSKMDDSFKFSQVTKTLLSILEGEVTQCPEEEIDLSKFVVGLDTLDQDQATESIVEALKR